MSENQGQHINAVDYASGQLTTAERQEMESHLANCVHCQAAVEAVRQVDAEWSGQTTRALVGYVADLLVSTVVLVAPIATQLSQPPPPPEPHEKTTEPPFFEPLRVLQPHVAAGARIERQTTGMELSLVLDNTGSMWGSKFTAMQAAAYDLVDIIYGDDTTVDNLWVSLVPYTASVPTYPVVAKRTRSAGGGDRLLHGRAGAPGNALERVGQVRNGAIAAGLR